MLDLIICIATGIGIYAGFRIGFIRQTGSLVALFAAVLACHFFGDIVAGLAASCMDIDQSDRFAAQKYHGAALLGNAILFVAVWWGVGLIARLSHDIIKAIHLGGINGLLGAIFMALKVLIAASLLINVWLVKDPGSGAIGAGGPIVKFAAGLGPRLLGLVCDNF